MKGNIKSPNKDLEKKKKEAEEAAKLEAAAAEAIPEQNVVHIETEGFGKFEFIDGTIYEGQWKLIDNVKMRHGEGTLRHSGIDLKFLQVWFVNSIQGSSSETAEEYRGTWAEDKMHGYGVYRYTSGAVYSGEWVKGKQEGKVILDLETGVLICEGTLWISRWLKVWRWMERSENARWWSVYRFEWQQMGR